MRLLIQSVVLYCYVFLVPIFGYQNPGTASTCACGPCTCADVSGELPRPTVTLAGGLEVVCDTDTEDGGWIVFQRRASAEVDFYRGWADYKYGFGDLHGNFWWGLEKLHQVTSTRQYQMRVDLVVNGTQYYAEYDNFMIFGEAEKYKIRVSGYSGTSGDAMANHNGWAFTTLDQDNDNEPYNCAVKFHGAWWYVACHHANLNGHYGDDTYGQGLDWLQTHGDFLHSATFTEMKIRPVNFN